jgi:hypothetical protein
VVETLEVFAGKGVLTMAQLPNGHIWCLPQLQHLQLIQVCSRMGAKCVCVWTGVTRSQSSRSKQEALALTALRLTSLPPLLPPRRLPSAALSRGTTLS